MAQKFLRRFEVYACRPKIGGKRVAKAMPPDCFALDSGPRHCGADDFLEQRIRGQRLFSFKSNRGKEEIVVAWIGESVLHTSRDFTTEGWRGTGLRLASVFVSPK